MTLVYKAIANIAADLSKTGIQKNHTSQQQYKFRGIDDVYNALAPLLKTHGLVILPRVKNRTTVERATKNGGAVFYTTVEAEFDLVSVEDGSKHTVTTFGEAMDTADKSTNKAMSAAYKYAAFQSFCIPTEGDNDADATTHDVVYSNDADDGCNNDLIDDAYAYATTGSAEYKRFWDALTPQQKTFLTSKGHHSKLKEKAAQADSNNFQARSAAE